MDVTNYLSSTSSLSVNPLKNDSNIAALKTLEEVIRTCIGPYGNLKAIQNAAGGHVTVTSSSQRLFPIISIQNTLLKLIASSTKTHLNCFSNNGLCCCFLTLKLVTNSLFVSYPLPFVGKLFEHFGKIFIDNLNIDKNTCVLNMDWSNLGYFQSVILTVLQSKPGCILRDEDLHHLCILLMKAHLSCIPSPPSLVYHKNINFICLESASCDKSSLFEGLLVRPPEMALKNLTLLFEKSNVKIVLYTSSLSGDADFPTGKVEVENSVDIWDAVLTSMKEFFEKLIKAKIHLLACQKVVHPSLKKQLEDANVFVLDRLGFETAKHLEYLSGASNSSLFSETSFGYLTSIKKITVGKKEFLCLSNETKPFWTMLICNFNEQAVNETKVVCQQAIDSLFRLLKKPFVCLGAGCTEIYTSKLVELEVLRTLEGIQQEIGCTTSQILEALKIFQQSVTDLAVAFHQGSSLNFATETIFGHLWRLKDGDFPAENDKCACGKFLAKNVGSFNWKTFTKSSNTLADVTDFHPVKFDENIDKTVLLDELSSKINAYSLAFETASLLLRTSVCICG